MYKVGDKVKSVVHTGIFEIVASRKEPKRIKSLTIPPEDSDYALKRVDGIMENDFEPFIFINKDLVEKL